MSALTPEQRQKAVQALVEHLPEYSQATDLLTEAVRDAVGGQWWVEHVEEQGEAMKETYAHLKQVAGVKLLDEHLTTEDKECLEQALKLLSHHEKESDEEAIRLIKKAMEL